MSSHFVGQSRSGGSTAARAGVIAKARRQYLSGLAAAGIVVLAVFLAFAPSQALLGPEAGRNQAVVAELLPQGWAFFTKDPREPYVSLYQQREQTWEQINSTTVAGEEHLFGFDRSARTENYEIDVITSVIPGEEWVECEKELITRCLPDSPAPRLSIESHGEGLRFCGVVAVTTQEPVPWAWGGLIEQMPGDYAIVNVECNTFQRGQAL